MSRPFVSYSELRGYAFDGNQGTDNSSMNARHDDHGVQAPSQVWQSPGYGRLNRPSTEKSYTKDTIEYSATWDAQDFDDILFEAGKAEYKPTALRWPYLTALTLAFLATLGSLAYAVATLPVMGSKTDAASAHAIEARRFDTPVQIPNRVLYVQETIIVTIDPAMAARREVGDESTTEDSSVTIPPKDTSNPDSMVSQKTSSYTSFIIAPHSSFGSIGDQTVTMSDSPATTPVITQTRTITKAGSDFDNIGSQTVTEIISYSSRPRSDFGNVGEQSVTESMPTTSEADLGSSSSIIIASSKASTDFGGAGDQTVTISDSSVSIATLTQATSQFGDVGSKTVTNSMSEPTSSPNSTPTIIIETEILTDAQGIPTATSSTIETLAFSNPRSDFGGIGEKTVTLGLTTVTDAQGFVLTTSTLTPSAISSLSLTTLTDSAGRPTSTSTSTILITPSLITVTDSSGHPTATLASYPGPSSGSNSGGTRVVVYHISEGQYFAGMFLPTLVASILAILVRIVDANAKIFQPWHALMHERGASGRESLCLETGGLNSFIVSFRSLLGGQAVVFLTSTLLLLSAVLVPLSSEAIGLDLRGLDCKKGGSTGRVCAYVLSASVPAANASLGLLSVMLVSAGLLLVLLGRWRLGVYANPWSICTLASLSLNQDLRDLILGAAAAGPKDRENRRMLGDRNFKLGYFKHNGATAYGITTMDNISYIEYHSPHPHHQSNEASALNSQSLHETHTGAKRNTPFFSLTLTGRMVLLFPIAGVLGVVLYYSQTGGDTGFENFIDSDTFGVRFLFTSFGVIISFVWSSFHDGIAIMSPYQLLARRPQPAARSILLAPPTNAFSGILFAFRTRRIYLGLVSFASILSEFLGIFLSNVPFQVTQTFLLSQISIWTSVSILSLMLLLGLVSFFMAWPNMPVDPSTIAGAMYYIADSPVLQHLEGMSVMDRKDRDRAIAERGDLYEFGEFETPSGSTKTGVNVIHTDGFMS
ncbi:hypothetical protein GGR57DRAFT_466667 [Xylariaceae sp. FL1272]|nr:hypothetical protein GGR57DRAFT_466667 [Xylariaceae sp. FL1272]